MRPFSVSLLAFLLTALPLTAQESPKTYQARRLGSQVAVSLADLHGQVVLLNTWATWCGPCRAEMPTLEVAYQQYRTHGLTVVAVNVDEGGDRSVQQAVDALRVTYPIWRDPRNRFARHFRVQGLPETFLIGRDGAVRYHWQGQVDPITPANQHRIRLALGLPPTDAGRALQRRGRRLAEQRGCITCHSTDGSWRNGPPWRQLLNQPVVLTDGRITIRDRSYLRRALLEPDADIVSGYAAGLMAGALPGQPLTEDELEALLLYLESL